jgi:hypothetical protein
MRERESPACIAASIPLALEATQRRRPFPTGEWRDAPRGRELLSSLLVARPPAIAIEGAWPSVVGGRCLADTSGFDCEMD